MIKMNKKEYEELDSIWKANKIITVGDLKNKQDRTLLYGYTCNRDTWHVYLELNEIICVIYEFGKKTKLVEIISNNDFVPDKRLYPARCDFEFCSILKSLGIVLPFTAFEEVELKGKYYGDTL
jgi:hypothetical protein